MKSPSAPKAPDPVATANAQTATNKETALWNAVLNNVNQITPYGNLTYTQSGGGPTYNMDAYNKALSAWNTSGAGGGPAMSYDEWSRSTGQAHPQAYEDYTNSHASGASTRGAIPKLEDFKTGDNPPSFTSTVDLAPAQKAQLESENRQTAAINSVAEGYLGKVSNVLNTPYNYDALPKIPGANDLAAGRKAVEDAMYSRLEPKFARDESDLRTRLANQGLDAGSEAFNREMDMFGQNKNDARQQVTLAGGQEESRLFGLGQANRNQAINEYDAQRNAPLNELNALRSSTQLTNPQFQNTSYQGAQPGDLMGATYNSYQGAMNNYNQKVASNNGMMGSIMGLGGQALGGYLSSTAGSTALSALMASDVRLKKDITVIGATPGGIPLYKFRYKWDEDDAPYHEGVMAQDVEKIIPEAVSYRIDGYKLVDYARIH